MLDARLMACSKLEAMAIYVVKQACGNDKLACVYDGKNDKTTYMMIEKTFLSLFYEYCH